jgi:hypothetical protein
MNPIQHPSNNDVLRPTEGSTRDDCRALPITRVAYPHPWLTGKTMPGVLSFWLPTPEQLALLNAGKPLFLSFMGHTHPPVAIGVEGDGRLT